MCCKYIIIIILRKCCLVQVHRSYNSKSLHQEHYLYEYYHLPLLSFLIYLMMQFYLYNPRITVTTSHYPPLPVTRMHPYPSYSIGFSLAKMYKFIPNLVPVIHCSYLYFCWAWRGTSLILWNVSMLKLYCFPLDWTNDSAML